MACLRRGRARVLAAAVTGGVAALLASVPATAQSCLEQLERFAASENIPPALPPVADGRSDDMGGAAIGPDALNRSGGVIRPPPVADPSVIEPPNEGRSAMPTMPEVVPEAGRSDAAPTGDTHGQAARRAQIEAAVTAARAAAADGDEQRCLGSLSSARRLADANTDAGGAGPGDAAPREGARP